MSDSNHHSAADEREESPAKSEEHSRSRSASRSRSRSRSGSSRRSSRSRSRSRSKHSRSYSRSRSRSRSHSHTKSSRSRERKRYRSYSRSRSPSPYYKRRDHSRSPLSDRKRHQGNREEPQPSRCLGIFGLSLYTTERDLKPIFEKYGPIEDINIVYDHQTGRSRGFGFVYYEYTEDAEMAKERTSGIELDGRRIRVDFSITKRAHTPTPGIYMGKPSQHRDYKRRRDDYRDDYRDRDDYYRERSSDRYEKRYRSRSRSYSPRRY
ncbi:transformer-2 protein homolog beta-like [Actinia tenebrosa]|uniref:Transformer-2 protein homolog beta-like n=1 Tax=Actinia tenebrosa TaxID=6105 RepID=A0A6P8IIT5_ACTTE|nr:transformer-2 protein homolog beta-like [Actinia tenebrosa]